MSILDTIKKTINTEDTGKKVKEKVIQKKVVKSKSSHHDGVLRKGVNVHKYYDVIRYPYITEKAAFLQEKYNTYMFAVAPWANKSEIIKAIKHIFNVTPSRVNIAKKPSKKVFLSGHKGKSAIIKKAMVTLPEGKKIDIGSA